MTTQPAGAWQDETGKWWYPAADKLTYQATPSIPTTPSISTVQAKVQATYDKYQVRSTTLLKQWTVLEEQYKALQQPVLPSYQVPGWKPSMVQPKYPYPRDLSGAYVVEGKRYAVTGAEETKTKQVITQMKVQMDSIASERNKAMFFSNALGMASDADILGSHLDMTADELIALAGTPPSMTKEETDELREVVQTQLDFLMGRLPEMAKETTKTELEKLVAPLPEPKPIGMTAMTVEAIKQSLAAPRVPDQIMTDAEWKEHLEAEVAVDPDMKSRADQKIKEWQDITSQLEANRQGIAELPTWKFWDYVKELIVTPGLALGESFMFYAEHVSQPLAGMLWKTMIPDIESAYQGYRKEGSTHREALVQAWQGWLAPGAGNWTPDWILKYVLMEGLVDPLTYVGWGILTKITKPLGAFGRGVGAAEKGLSELFELPFDAVKGIWNKLPKSIPQQSILVRARTGQYFKKALELDLLQQSQVTGSAIKTFRQATNQDLAGFIDRAIKHYHAHPASEDALAQAGRDLLLHKTFSQEQVVSLAKSLKSSFADDITSRNILEVNDIFEDFFTKVGNVDVAADRLVKSLDGSGKTATKDAVSWLNKQADNIVKEAQSFATYAKPVKGQMALMERNYRYTEDVLRSVAAAERMKLGRVASLFDQVTSTSSRIWANTIDRFVTRPFAIAYLTFGMYGPMNTVEDIIRSALGGVMPGTKSADFFELKWARTLYDPDLTLRKGISETYGVARELADDVTRNSWVITLSTAGLSLPTYGISGLVGKAITPEQFARGTRFVLNEFWNRVGADIRRNLVDRKATQILLSSGGDEIQQLVKAISRFEGTSSKSLNKEITNAVSSLALTGEPDAIRSVKGMFTHKKIQEKEVRKLIEQFTELPPETRNLFITKLRNGELFNETPLEGVKFPVAKRIDDTYAEALDGLRTSILKDPELASKQIEALTDLYVQVGIGSPEEMAQAMTTIHQVGSVKDMTSKEVLTRASKESRKLPFDERNPWINKALDDVAKFEQESATNITRLAETIRGNMTEAGVTPEYIVAGNHLLDLRTAKMVKLGSTRTDFREWQRRFFVGTTRERLHSNSFWDEFYNQLDNWIRRVEDEAIGFDTMIDAASKAVNRASGYVPPPGKPVIVKGRMLAPADVAQLLEVQGDDLSRAILDIMTIQHDRNRFVAYVMAQVDKDVGFTPESVGKVYDQLVSGIVGNQRTVDMLTARELQLDALRKDMHQYYNARTIKPEDIDAIGRYVDTMADSVDKAVYEPTPKLIENISTVELQFETANLSRQPFDTLTSEQASRLRVLRNELRIRGTGGPPTVTPVLPKVKKPIFQNYDELRQSAMDEAHKWYYKEYTDYTHANVIDDMMKYIYPFWCMPEYATILTKVGWKHYSELVIGEDVLVVDPKTMVTRWEPVKEIATFDYDDDLMVIPAKGKDIKFTPNHRWLTVTKRGHISIKRGYQLDDGYDMIPRALPHEFPKDSILSPRDASILGWMLTDGYVARSKGSKPRIRIYQSLHNYLIEIQELCGVKGLYRKPTGYSKEDGQDFVVITKLEDSDRILAICPDKDSILPIISQLSKPAAYAMWDAMFKAEGNLYIAYTGRENRSWKQNPGSVMQAFQLLSILLGKAITVNTTRVNILNNSKEYNAKECRRMYTEHYTGKVWCPVTPSGTWFVNCNGSILPTGNTYERSRWEYLPRALVKHPVVFTTLGKYINESDNGYVHIPNTNIDINPFRGTVFGTLTGSLTRRDYKSYYDSLPLGQFVEYNDFLSRYGFYPGAPWNLIQSALGGVEAQLGEALPSTAKSLLDVAVATFPDNKAMNFISDKLFSDRFRDYLTLKEVVRRGGDGALIGRKQRGKETLTEVEQQLWNDSRSQVSWYSAGFEQFGLFRMRPEEQIQIQQACTQAIFEMTGFTPDQQDWMRDHNVRIWDQVGGMSPSQQAILEALGYWKYSGISGELMPGSEQAIQDRISQDWDSVINYNQTIIMQSQLDLQRDFLNGIVGPDDYNARLKELYTQKQTYMDNKVLDNPLMLLENRADYYKQYGIVQPVMHPQKELLALYFSIELKEITNPDTGEKMDDWDSFYAERDAIDAAIPDEYRAEWDAVIQKNQTRVEGIRRTVYDTYFTKYNGIWDSILKRYSPEEQRLINEYLSLERLGRDLGRQEVIRNIIDSKGRQLISGFRSDVSSAKEALRFANPSLDAWLFYWGKTSSFQTPQAELMFNQIVKDTGRQP